MKNMKTALYEEHIRLKGQMVDFEGWQLPMTYDSINNEHKAVRTSCGIFDVSHMGEIEVLGDEAEIFLDKMLTCSIKNIQNNYIKYGFFCNQEGGIIDDILTYKINNTRYILVVNAANIEKDINWLKKFELDYNIEIYNNSQDISQIAIQGPFAEEILQKLTYTNLKQINFYQFEKSAYVAEKKCVISRTGYTGDDGFEIYCRNEDAHSIWNHIMITGKAYYITPCGLGARDTLRFEAGLPLYGNELTESITPYDAGLGMFVDLTKDNFIGKEPLKKIKENTPKKKLIKIEVENKKIPRHGYKVFDQNNNEIGEITTGYFLQSQKRSLATASVDYKNNDEEIYIQIRKNKEKAKVLKGPFYKKKYKPKK